MEFKKWEKIKIEYLIILLLTVFLYFNLTRFINNNTNKEVTSATILPKGFIEFGVFDENNEIIDNGSFIDTTNSNLITELQIGQHLDNEREYLLLIFKDYIQSEFKVNNIKHSNYKFKLNENDSISIKIEMENINDTKELDYIIVKLPNYKVKKDDFASAHILQEVLPLRFTISSEEKQIAYNNDFTTSELEPLDNVFISNNPDELKIQTEVNKDEDLYLILGNDNEKNSIDYCIISLKDWVQVPIQNDELYQFYTLKPRERIFFKLDKNNYVEDSNYQVIAFPYPFNVERNNIDSTNVYPTHRINFKD